MRGFILFCIILALPAAMVVGHDIYLYVNDTENLGFRASTLSWLWTHYELETYNWAAQNTDPELWKNVIVPVLKQKALIVALVPALTFYALLILLRVLRLGPFSGSGHVKSEKTRPASGKGKKSGGFSFTDGDQKKGRSKYKRK